MTRRNWPIIQKLPGLSEMDCLPELVLVNFKGMHIQIDFNGKTRDLRRRIFEKLSLESKISNHFEIYLDREGTVYAQKEIPHETKKVYLREVDGVPKHKENTFHVHFLDFDLIGQLKGVRCAFLDKLSKETFKKELSKIVEGKNVSENLTMNGSPLYGDWQLDEFIEKDYPYIMEVSESIMMASVSSNPVDPEEEKEKESEKKGMEGMKNALGIMDFE